VTNLVHITVKADGPSSDAWTKIKLEAAKAGLQAADAFNTAFKLKAGATVGGKSTVSQSAGGMGLAGDDKQLLNKLKSYANTPGGIGILGTGSDTSLISALKRQIMSGKLGVLPGSGGGVAGSGGGSGGTPSSGPTTNQANVTTTDMIRQVLAGQAASNVTTTDTIKQILSGNSPGNVSTADYIKQVLTGKTPGNISTEDVIHPKVDDSDIKSLGEKDGKTYGSGFASSLKNALSGLLSGHGGGKGGSGIGKLITGGGGGDDEGIGKALNVGGAVGGALPGVAGLSGMQATITGLAGAFAALLPAIVSVGAGLATIGGGFMILESSDKKFAADMKSTMGSLESIFKAAAMPLAKPLEQAATQIVGYFKQIGPQLKTLFGDSAQLIQPLVKGFEALMSGAGPGFLAMIKAAGPVFKSMSGAFGDLGKSLGEMFHDFASDGAGSATMLKGLLGIVNSLLPFIGQLGKIMVSALAPAFKAFSGALASVLPALTPLLKIIGSLAGAVMGDLGSVLGAVGKLLQGLAPSFTTLAKVASNLFSTLENTGIFAILGDSLESLAKPISNLVNVLVQALAPSLPQIITLISQVSAVIATLIAAGLSVLINALASVVKFLSPILPLLLDAIVAWKALTIAVTAFNLVMDIDPFVAIASAMVLLVALVIKYHTQILSFIEATWDKILAFLKQWWPLLLGIVTGGLGLIIGAVIKYHDQIFSAIKDAWNKILSFFKSIWNSITSYFGGALSSLESKFSSGWDSITSGVKSAWNGIASTIQGIWSTTANWVTGHISSFVGAVKGSWATMQSDASSAWNTLKGIFEAPVNFLIGTVYDNGIKKLWNDVMGAVGLGSLDLPQVSTLAEGGRLPGFGGGDKNLALLEDGETVVDKHRSRQYAGAFAAMGVPGYANGGIVGDAGAVAKMVLAAGTGNETAFSNAFSSILPGGGGGSSGHLAAAIAAYPVHLVTDIVKGLWSKVNGAGGAGGGGGAPGTYSSANLLNVGKYMKSHGYSRAAAAGIASCVAGESGGNPEAMQGGPSGGGGLIQWTPISAYPGLVTNNPLKDFNNQLPAILRYNNAQGAGNIAALNRISAPISAADFYSQVFERPQVRDSDVRPSVATSIYQQLDHGGWLPTGTSIVHNGTGRPERVPDPGMAGGGSMNVTLSVGGGSASDQILISLLKEAIRTRGGKVQAVLGTGPA